jgi:HD superfamily phosphohydrolase YqeK
MTEALTGTPWLAVLTRIKKYSDDDTTRTLAAVLYDIVKESHDRKVDDILDAYAFKILGSL